MPGMQSGVDYKDLEGVSKTMTFEGDRQQDNAASSGFHKLVRFTKLIMALSVTAFVTITASGSSFIMGNTSLENHGPSDISCSRVRKRSLYRQMREVHGADGRGDLR